MRFSRDRRGQSVVVGTVILFGFLIVALSLYQVQVVPQENTNVEFEHSQQVEGEFLEARNAILSASRIGDGRSTSLKLGTRYPQRTFTLNPPPASGQLSTTDPRELRIENATVEGDENVVEYWTNRTDADGAIAFDTRSLRYSPDYNELQNGADLVYEHSLVVAEFDSTALGRTGQTVVDGDRLRLTALDGNVDTSGVERTTLDPEALSQSRRTVRLSSTGGDPIVLELPTDVSMDQAESLEQQWRDRLDLSVEENENVSVQGGTVRIRLNGTESYRLELAKVGLGTDTSAPNESTGYITKVSSNNGIAVAEVRDRFNNPVEDAEVEIDFNNDGTVDQTNLTDEEGRVEYETDTVSDVGMYINGTSGGDPWESVLFKDLGTADGSSSDFNRIYNVTWNDPGPLMAGTTPEVTGTVRGDGELLDNATVDFATNSSIATFQGENTSTTTVDGEFTTNITTTEEGAATLFAASGDDVDRLDVTVTNSPGPVPFGVFVQGEESVGQNGDIDADFEVDSGSEVFRFDVNLERSGRSDNYNIKTVTIDGGAFDNEELTLTPAVARDLGAGNEIDLLNPDIYDSVNDSDLQSISDQLDSNSAVEFLNNQGSVNLEQPDVREQ